MTHANPNERRADQAMRAVDVATDRNYRSDPADLSTDLSDLVAHVGHLCERHGIEFDSVLDRGHRSYEGDSEDGPPAARRELAPLCPECGSATGWVSQTAMRDVLTEAAADELIGGASEDWNAWRCRNVDCPCFSDELRTGEGVI